MCVIPVFIKRVPTWCTCNYQLRTGRLLELSPLLSFKPTDIEEAINKSLTAAWAKQTVVIQDLLNAEVRIKRTKDSVVKFTSFARYIRSMARDARAAPALFQAVRVDADEWNRRVQEEEAAEDEVDATEGGHVGTAAAPIAPLPDTTFPHTVSVEAVVSADTGPAAAAPLPDAPAAAATLPNVVRVVSDAVQAADAAPAGDAVLAATPATVPSPTELKHKARMVCAVESFVLWSVHTARASVHGAQNPASV
jgi:hypothetical protein